MARNNDSWGIEVGANAIKAMRLVRAGKGVDLVDYEILPFKQVLTTPDVNIDEMIQVGLDSFLAKHDVSKTNVVISVPGHMAFARFAKLPPVEPKKIPDIVRFEAVQQIPFPIDQVEWDYQVFQQEDSPDVEVGIFAITKERVLNFLSNYRHVGMRVDALTLSPLAVYNAFAYENAGGGSSDDDDAPAGGTIYMDIGASSTDVIIVEHGGIWLRTLPIGGNNFTEALVKAFKLSFSKAEKLKKEAGTSKYARQIFQAMRPVFADLVQEMQRSIGYYQSLNRDAELTRLVGVGSTFRLPGLQKFLKQQLQMEVTRPDGFKRLAVEGKQQADFAENALNMATAYGLALQGLGLESVTANVLPQHILRQRLWRSKQPWIAAAAACIAVASGLAGARYFYDQSVYDAAYEETNARVQPIINRGQSFVNQWNEITTMSDPRVQIENLRRVLDYRDVWPKLLEDITAAAAAVAPQPETLSAEYDAIKNIPAPQRRRFYINSVNVEYQAQDPQQAAAAAGAAVDPMMDMGMGMSMGMGGGRAGAQRSPTELLATQYTTDQFFGQPGSDTGPQFIVTVSGTTTHANPVQFISQNFIGWLRENGNRPDRPYRIVIDPSTVIQNQWRVTEEQARQNRRNRLSRGGYSGGIGMAGGMGGMYDPMMDPGMMDDPAMMGGRSRATRRSTPTRGQTPAAPEQVGGIQIDPRIPGFAQQPQEQEPLLPARPVRDERSVGAHGFEIKFTVRLVRPEEARRAENGNRTMPAAPSEGDDPTSPPSEETQQAPVPEQAVRPAAAEEVSS